MTRSALVWLLCCLLGDITSSAMPRGLMGKSKSYGAKSAKSAKTAAFKGYNPWHMSMKKSGKKEEITKYDKIDENTKGYYAKSGKAKSSKSAKSGKGSSKGSGKGSDDSKPTPSPTRKDDLGTSSPTITAAPTLTFAPTPTPSSPAPTREEDMQTSSPTITAAPTLTFAPTTETPPPSNGGGGPPNGQPTDPPFVPACETDNGVFGRLDGNALSVAYGYELETDPDTLDLLQSQIIPPLEVGFNDYLLPILFPTVCAIERRRLIVVEGITTTRADEPILGIPCQTPKEDNANECVYVRGRLTLFTDEPGPGTEYINTVRSGLQLGMTNGAFNDAQENIVKVTYVESDDEGFPPDRTPTVSPTEFSTEVPIEAQSDDNDLLLPLLLAAGAVVIVVAGVITYRKTTSPV